jgi:hypothetical protein
MGQKTLDGVNLSRLRAEYDQKIHDMLPAQARASGNWPIEADHCFARVVLDNLFGGVWYDHVDGRPAYKHLSQEKLHTAIEIADQMLANGRPVVADLNENSLQWRTDRQRD